jgi:hypothetical protein
MPNFKCAVAARLELAAEGYAVRQKTKTEIFRNRRQVRRNVVAFAFKFYCANVPVIFSRWHSLLCQNFQRLCRRKPRTAKNLYFTGFFAIRAVGIAKA